MEVLIQLRGLVRLLKTQAVSKTTPSAAWHSVPATVRRILPSVILQAGISQRVTGTCTSAQAYRALLTRRTTRTSAILTQRREVVVEQTPSQLTLRPA